MYSGSGYRLGYADGGLRLQPEAYERDRSQSRSRSRSRNRGSDEADGDERRGLTAGRSEGEGEILSGRRRVEERRVRNGGFK